MLELLCALLCAIGLLAFLAQRFLLSPTAIFYAYSSLALPGSYLITRWLDMPSVFFDSPRQLAGYALATCVGATVLGWASFSIGRFGPWRAPAFIHSQPLYLRSHRFPWVLGASVLLAVWGGLDLVSSLGGIARISEELGAVRSGELAGKGIQVYALTFLLPTCLQWYLVLVLRQDRRHPGWVLALCLASCLLGAALGFRGPALALLLQVGVIWFLLRGIPSRKKMLTIMLVLASLVTLLGLLRLLLNVAALETITTAGPQAVASYVANTALTRVRGFETFVMIRQFVDDGAFMFFLSNIRESFQALIPSVVLAKPVPVAEQIANEVFANSLFAAGILRDSYGGVSYTFIAEGYWNAGWIGICIYGLALGLLFRWVESSPRAGMVSNLRLLVYKAVVGFTLVLVEAPQLGVNAILVNIAVNAVVLLALSVAVAPRRAVPLPASRPQG